MASLIKSYNVSAVEVEGELILQGRYSIQKLLTNTVTRYYKTVEYNDGTSPSQYLIKDTPKNILSIYLYCTGFVRKYKLPTVSDDYQEYLTIYIADDQATYYLFEADCFDNSIYNEYTPPEKYLNDYTREITNTAEDELCQFILKHLSGSGEGSDDGTALTIPDKYFFDTITDRDDYFDNNPTELASSPYVVVGSQLYKYNALEEVWEEITPALMGPKGEPGLSANISVGTTTTLQPGTNAYVVKDAASTEINSIFNFGIPKGEGAELSIKGNYNASTAYVINDVVIAEDGNTYICIQDSTGNEPSASPDYWQLMVHKGEQGPQGIQGEPGATPEIDPNNKHWIIDGHDTGVVAEAIGNKWIFTNSLIGNTTTVLPISAISTDDIKKGDVVLSQNVNSFNWYAEVTNVTSSLITVSYKGKLTGLLATIPTYSTGTYYEKDELVEYNGILYRANQSFLAEGSFDENYWTGLKTKLISIYDDWEAGTEYSWHEAIVYKNIIYRCLAGSVTQSLFNEIDLITYWTLINEPSAWATNHIYEEGDLAYYTSGSFNGIIECTTAHTSGASFDTTEQANWILWKEEPGNSEWEANEEYGIGKVVEHDYKLYQCITPVEGGTQSVFTPVATGIVWEELGARAHQHTIDLTDQLDGTKTSFDLGNVSFPYPGDTRLLLNGQEYDYDTHYTITTVIIDESSEEPEVESTLIIKSSIPTPKTTDRLSFKYWK